MPGYAAVLNDSQIESLIPFVRSLKSPWATDE